MDDGLTPLNGIFARRPWPFSCQIKSLLHVRLIVDDSALPLYVPSFDTRMGSWR